ncbi:MAG: hypothetical protein LBU86_04525 [Oscillospiraceae bacterium]|jgi:hypothetical protein|nr:hypothetical protein [Oscillospiraceae bacterium]
MMIRNYSDFCRELLSAGFSIAGGNNEGVFGLIDFDWRNEPRDSPVRWHTGDPDTDPWEWRIRVLDDRDDISYAKVFFRKGGFITREWYPYFLAARRGGGDFGDFYSEGLVSRNAKRLVDALKEHHTLPLHELKRVAGFGKEDKSQFERALLDLQAGLFVTVSGTAQKRNKYGEEYGWHTTCFCLTESFWPPEVFERAGKLDKGKAIDAITERVYRLNPAANGKKVKKFILG